MAEVEADLARWIESIEAYLAGRKAGADFRASEIEELATQWETRGAQVEASWLRECTSIRYIRNAVSECRAHLNGGDIDQAYSIYKEFERTRAHIRSLLDQRHVTRGRKVLASAKAGHKATYGDDLTKQTRWQRISADYAAERAKRTPKAASVVAKRHGISERTVHRIEKYLAKID